MTPGTSASRVATLAASSSKATFTWKYRARCGSSMPGATGSKRHAELLERTKQNAAPLPSFEQLAAMSAASCTFTCDMIVPRIVAAAASLHNGAGQTLTACPCPG